MPRKIIITERCPNDFCAEFEDAPEQWGVGSTAKEALGDLLRVYGGFQVEVRKLTEPS